jgi:hypothetical protein
MVAGMRSRNLVAETLTLILVGALYSAPVYDKTAEVFLSKTTADGFHVGNHVCYETTNAIDCFPDEPRKEYRLEFTDGTFATCRFIVSNDTDLDAIALIFEKRTRTRQFGID